MKARFWVLVVVLLLTAQAAIAADDADVKEVVAGNNKLAFELYGQLRTQPGNIVFSPYSVSAAFALAYAGARGQTASEMEHVLHFSLGQEKIHPAMSSLMADLQKRGNRDKNQLLIASALWGQKGFKFLPEFVKTASTFYKSGFEQVDFKKSPEDARKAINTWAEKQTQGKITDVLGQGSIDSMTRLVLANAIFFDGKWESPFKAEHTRSGPFWLSPENQADVPMMSQK